MLEHIVDDRHGQRHMQPTIALHQDLPTPEYDGWASALAMRQIIGGHDDPLRPLLGGERELDHRSTDREVQNVSKVGTAAPSVAVHVEDCNVRQQRRVDQIKPPAAESEEENALCGHSERLSHPRRHSSPVEAGKADGLGLGKTDHEFLTLRQTSRNRGLDQRKPLRKPAEVANVDNTSGFRWRSGLHSRHGQGRYPDDSVQASQTRRERPTRKSERTSRRSQSQVIALTGRLTADPELRTTEKGTVASLRLAIQRPRKEGEDQGADFVDIAVFGRQGETCAQYLAKGRKVAIEGRLHHSEWDSDNGRRQKLEVVARNVEFLDPRKTNDADDGPAAEDEAETPIAF